MITNNTERSPTTLKELMLNSATAAFDYQQESGAFPASDGGIYTNRETPVRTTARWLKLFIHLYELERADILSERADRAADFLVSTQSIPERNTFYIRKTGQDRCDGLVGQAGPIDGLARAGAILGRPELTNTAKTVFLQLPFNDSLGLWEAVDIDGEKLSFDRTLNHQIIFASAASELAKILDTAQSRILRFLDKLRDNIRTRSNGLVRHYVRPPLQRIIPTVGRHPRHWPLLWNEAAARYHTRSDERYRKELGYHPTVLAALSTLKRKFPKHDVWEHDQIQASLSFTKTKTYRDQIKNRTSEYGSMLPGINHARVLYAFEDASPEELRPWVQSDIDRTYDSDTGLLTRNAVDPVFQASSIVTATELPDMEIQIPDEQNSESY